MSFLELVPVHSSSSKWITLGIALFAAWMVHKVLYALFFSPPRKIPGPFLARLSPLWLRIIDLSGHRTTTLHKLHQQYGTTVVLGPHEVSLSDVSNVKELYGQQTNFIKAPVYESMTLPPIGIFSLRDKTAHAKRRRLLSHAFSQSNLQECEPLIDQQIQKLLGILDRNLGKPLDALTWFRRIAFDVVGELFLGRSFGGLESGRTPEFLNDIDAFFILADLKWNNPLIASLLTLVPLKSIKHFLGAMQRLADYGEKAFLDYIGQYGRNSGRRDLLTKILTVTPDGRDGQLSDKETSVEIGNLVFAGTDTTSTTLTLLFWELSRHEQWQNLLREEIRTRVDGPVTFQKVQDLPILDAVINEALRLHPAAPASLPRETPAGGRQINGYFIPQKTIVSIQCYTTQRDPSAYPNPEEFHPERWMETTDVMKELFMPFSKGTRACLGKNLAMIELKLITAQIAQRFKWAPAPSTTEESMAITDHFLLIPVGGKCELVFSHVDAKTGI